MEKKLDDFREDGFSKLDPRIGGQVEVHLITNVKFSDHNS